MAWAAVQLRQICADYSGLKPQGLTIEEIRFFYLPLIDGLCKLQKETGKRR
jgi:hypothetical protein